MGSVPRQPVRALQALRGESRDLWCSADVRRAALENIAGLWTMGETMEALEAARAVDTSVADGLRALGFSRGPVVVQIAAQSRGEHGVKTHTCVLVISVNYLIGMLRSGGKPDSVFRTWVHESIHARIPFPASFYEDEWKRWKGYEEGLAEGLARLITRNWARMDPLNLAYDGYVRAYRALARALGVDIGLIWGSLYGHRNGQVRDRLPTVVGRVRSDAGGRLLDPSRVLSVADELFDSARDESVVRSSDMVNRWRWALA